MRVSESRTRAHKIGRPYRCFLVRCRLEEGASTGEPGAQPAWRFTVEQAGDDSARRSFACFHDVAAHLEAELASCGAFARHSAVNTEGSKP